jgi:hypothetical protein
VATHGCIVTQASALFIAKKAKYLKCFRQCIRASPAIYCSEGALTLPKAFGQKQLKKAIFRSFLGFLACF